MLSGVQRAGCAMVLKHQISGMLDFGHAGFWTGRISDRRISGLLEFWHVMCDK